MPKPLFIPKPICDVCEHEVEVMNAWHHPMKHMMVIQLQCHGQVETIEVEHIILARYERETVEVGRAFLKHKAALPPKP